MDLMQVVTFGDLSEPDNRVQCDKTRPYSYFPELTEKLVYLSAIRVSNVRS